MIDVIEKGNELIRYFIESGIDNATAYVLDVVADEVALVEGFISEYLLP
ncbi:hypothetical protein KbCgl_08010 [Corynebacterium glutamicum]|nr:hypothetical protein KbCgl_08010 [Corynebacterium glutamicum]